MLGANYIQVLPGSTALILWIYSHQERPLVRLFGPTQNVTLLFSFGAVCFHIVHFFPVDYNKANDSCSHSEWQKWRAQTRKETNYVSPALDISVVHIRDFIMTTVPFWMSKTAHWRRVISDLGTAFANVHSKQNETKPSRPSRVLSDASTNAEGPDQRGKQTLVCLKADQMCRLWMQPKM